MPTATIEPFEGPVTVVNGFLKSEIEEFDGQPALPGLREGLSYYVHAEYGEDGSIYVRNFVRILTFPLER